MKRRPAYAYETISPEFHKQLTKRLWDDRPADYAARDDVSPQVTTIRTMREANQRTTKLVTASLVSQVVAIILLSVSIRARAFWAHLAASGNL